MATRGLEAFAQLRMRDRKPGPADYGNPRRFSSEAGHRSILRRTREPVGWVNPVGPGTYRLGSTMGTGRAARLPPHASDVAPGDTGPARPTSSPTRSSTPRAANGSGAADVFPPTWRSDTPAFSLYGKVAHPAEGALSGLPNVGPASYDVPSMFDSGRPLGPAERNAGGSSGGGGGRAPLSRGGVPKGKSFGHKTEALGAWLTSSAPGPGTYNLPSFTDALAQNAQASRNKDADAWLRPKQAPLGGTSPRWVRDGADNGSGNSRAPGDYDDPDAIATATRCSGGGGGGGGDSGTRSLALVTHGRSTFGSRHTADGGNPFDTVSASPGPAAHTAAAETEVLGKYAGKEAPRFVQKRFPPVEELRHGSRRKTAASSSLFHLLRLREPQLPSDFDRDYHKGYSMLGRWPDHAAPKQPKHRFDLEEEERAATWHACGPQASFAAHPYDPITASLDEERARCRVEKSITPGPGSYAVRYDAVQPRSKGVLVAESEWQPEQPRVPGPCHYHPKHTSATSGSGGGGGGGGTTFHKGDFNPRSTSWAGRHEQDRSVNTTGTSSAKPTTSSLPSGKANNRQQGFTFGIQYPARALHQLAPPKDAFTNTNCNYADERRWESAPVATRGGCLTASRRADGAHDSPTTVEADMNGPSAFPRTL